MGRLNNSLVNRIALYEGRANGEMTWNEFFEKLVELIGLPNPSVETRIENLMHSLAEETRLLVVHTNGNPAMLIDIRVQYTKAMVNLFHRMAIDIRNV